MLRLLTLGAVRPLGFLICLAALMLLSVTPSSAQYVAFGKNKVHYVDWEWRVLESEHFDLYYYEEIEELARLAMKMAEESYTDLQGKFVHDVRRRIPLIIYNSFQDFEQNNITPFFLPEGVAGLTEFARGRVLVPFNGSLSDFRTTIHHEMVHVFQLSLRSVIHQENFKTPFLNPPLWISEGLAVHWTETRDPQADMILRDLVHYGNLPAIENFWRYGGSFYTYKLGQSVLDYVGENFGEDRIHELYRRLWLHVDYADLIQDVLGISQKELSDRWAFELRQRYYPEVEGAEPASFASRPLTGRGGANMKGIPLADSLGGRADSFVFASPRSGFSAIYLASLDGKEREVETLIQGERSKEFESLHLFQIRFDASKDGRLIFSTKHEEKDEIVIFDIESRKVVDRIAFDSLVAIASPMWAGDGRRFVFSGLSRDGFSDIYLYDLDADELTRLTHDRYEDSDPAFCPWDDAVVFSSDRCPGGREGARNLFWLDLDTGSMRHLTRGEWVDSAPAFDPNTKKIYFVSDRDRFSAVYRIDEGGDGRKLTHSLDGVFDPRPIPGKNEYLATVFREGQFQIHRFAIPDSTGDSEAIALAPANGAGPWHWGTADPVVASRRDTYDTDFSLDFAQGGLLVDSQLRTGEGLSAAFSDLMGNHVLIFGLSNTTFSTSDFLRNFSVAGTYLNLERRLNYGFSVFHTSGDFYDTLDFPYFEQRSGVAVLLNYPLSKFQRIETSFSVAYAETARLSTNFYRKGAVGTHFVSFVHDNSLWLNTGPIDGSRFKVSAGLTMNLNIGQEENTALLIDYRRYFRIRQFSAYAVRAQGRWSDGDNPEFYWIGGSHHMRTYDRRALVGRKTLMLNQEIRFPLVRGLVLGLPMGNLELPGVQGALFVDAGSAWDEGWPPPWFGAYGFGFRMGFGGYLVLRLDVGRRTNFNGFWGDQTHTRFFVGWNY